jgi:hypothetical protein
MVGDFDFPDSFLTKPFREIRNIREIRVPGHAWLRASDSPILPSESSRKIRNIREIRSVGHFRELRELRGAFRKIIGTDFTSP